MSENFIAKDQNGVVIPGTVTYDAANRVAKWNSDAPMPANTDIVFEVKDVKDVSGNPIAAPYIFGFRTGNSADVQPPTILGTSPAQGAENVSTEKEVVITFSEPMDQTTITA